MIMESKVYKAYNGLIVLLRSCHKIWLRSLETEARKLYPDTMEFLPFLLAVS